MADRFGESSAGLPPAGWYDDPQRPGAKRFWDGTRWTETVAGPNPIVAPGGSIGGPPVVPPPPAPPPPPSAPGGPAAVGPAPPFHPLPPGAHAVGPGDSFGAPPTGSFGPRINDIGTWLRRTFSMIAANPIPIVGLALCSFPFWAATLLLGHRGASEVLWTIDSGNLSGLDGPVVTATVVLAVLSALVSIVSYLGLHHLLHSAHRGRPIDTLRSLRVGLARAPRFIGLTLVIYLGSALAIIVPFGLFVVAVVQGADGVVALLLLSLVTALAMMAFLVWFWVKAVVFLPVSTTVVGRGTSALTAAWRISSGRFWPILGRVVVVFALVGTVSTVFQLIGQALAPTVLFSKFDISDDGSLIVDGRDIDTIDVLRLGDVLPNPVALLAYFGLFALVTAASQAITASALCALYVDAGGQTAEDG